MTDIYDAIARGFRYPPRPQEAADDELNDDYDEVPSPPLALPPDQATSLARAIVAGVQARGCDNTLRVAQAWARREKVRWAWLRDALEERGGFCDCEVLLNVLEPPD